MQHAYYITRPDLTHNLVNRECFDGSCLYQAKDAIVTALVMRERHFKKRALYTPPQCSHAPRALTESQTVYYNEVH